MIENNKNACYFDDKNYQPHTGATQEKHHSSNADGPIIINVTYLIYFLFKNFTTRFILSISIQCFALIQPSKS